jgi:hypothetical protein
MEHSMEANDMPDQPIAAAQTVLRSSNSLSTGYEGLPHFRWP